MAKEVSGKIIETYGILEQSASGKMIYASISWNDRAPKDEIRNIWIDADGVEHLGKGIAISDDQMVRLIEAFQRKGGNFKKPVEPAVENTSSKKSSEEGVDFNQIFKDSQVIADMRAAGNPTEDGFIRLAYKPGWNPHKLKTRFVKKDDGK